MALLDETDRLKIWRGLMRYWSNMREAVAVITKAELKAAIDATDAWINSNQASFNTALPNPAKDNLTAEQKTLMFCAVALMRIDPGLAQLLRRALGVEVD